MNLTPSKELYEAATKALSKDREPKKEIGQMCHHMVLDLLVRAGLVKMEQVKGKFMHVQNFQDLFERNKKYREKAEKLEGPLELTEAVNSQSIILFIDVNNGLGQHPAHSLVTMGNGEVAGYNNVGSLDPAQFDIFKTVIADNNFCKFPLSCLKRDNKTIWGVSPKIFAEKWL